MNPISREFTVMPEFAPALMQSVRPICSEGNPEFVSEYVENVLAAAGRAEASDVHFLPTADKLEVWWRIDGVLQQMDQLSRELSPRVAARLKVLAQLLTYHSDIPQEGRIREVGVDLEKRVSTFPTLFGEKVVVRLLPGLGRFRALSSLGFPDDLLESLQRALQETGGIVLLTGPAGSGKTTTIYACMRELSEQSLAPRSLVSLEDPIEAVVPGVAQSQVNPAAGFTLESGLRSLLRQDPEVIMVGEIRDRTVAEIVFQASLTGHLVLTTFHAGSAAGAISRLSDMGIEPYLLRSGLRIIVSQRLVRRLCDCATPGSDEHEKLGLQVESFRIPVGCDKCRGTGYRGRMVLAELLSPGQDNIGRAILSRSDTSHLDQLARQAGMVSRWSRACQAVEAGFTSPAEVRRTFGLGGAD